MHRSRERPPRTSRSRLRHKRLRMLPAFLASLDRLAPESLNFSRTGFSRGRDIALRCGRLQLGTAQRNVSCFHQCEDFVARHYFHFLDRARCNDRRDFPDARLDDYFTDDFVGHDAFHGSRKLVADALFHKFRTIAPTKSDVSVVSEPANDMREASDYQRQVLRGCIRCAP